MIPAATQLSRSFFWLNLFPFPAHKCFLDSYFTGPVLRDRSLGFAKSLLVYSLVSHKVDRN